jgi:hypothetical protein
LIATCNQAQIAYTTNHMISAAPEVARVLYALDAAQHGMGKVLGEAQAAEAMHPFGRLSLYAGGSDAMREQTGLNQPPRAEWQSYVAAAANECIQEAMTQRDAEIEKVSQAIAAITDAGSDGSESQLQALEEQRARLVAGGFVPRFE